MSKRVNVTSLEFSSLEKSYIKFSNLNLNGTCNLGDGAPQSLPYLISRNYLQVKMGVVSHGW